MTTKDETKAPEAPKAPKVDASNPSGASDEQLAKGEMAGKVRGRDVDESFHTYEFTDPVTGEPVEWTPVVHDVAVGVNSDGSLKTEKANETFVKPADGGDAPKAPKASDK